VFTIVFPLLLVLSGIAQIRRDPRPVQAVHGIVGVPMKFFPLLAACEFAGALGLLAGNWLPALGIAVGIGVALYFVGAIAGHLRVGDAKGVAPAVFMLALAAIALALRVLTYAPGVRL
jgi:hypothetical protein